MLDRSKVLQALQTISNNLFTDHSDEIAVAHQVWDIICNDPEFAIKVAAANCPDLLLPTWQGNLSDVYDVNPTLSNYSVTAIDGSQIYPDKHQGTTCYLLNIGTVHLAYGTGVARPVQLNSTPFVFTGQDEDAFDNSQEMINCRRQALELQAGALFYSARPECPLKPQAKTGVSKDNLLLFDGSLIFWHLDSKDKNIQHYFLPKYFSALEQLTEQQTLFASYISLPKSRELTNLVRFYLREEITEDAHPEYFREAEMYRRIDHVIDTTLAHYILQQHQRTTVFYNHSAITQHYPEHLMPCFFYLHVGDEIARIEIPFWIAIDKTLTDRVAYIALNQSLKGHGYPVCLAEAHEQAVVKGPDRDFFYHIVQKLGIEQKKRISVSLKSMKKRRIGI